MVEKVITYKYICDLCSEEELVNEEGKLPDGWHEALNPNIYLCANCYGCVRHRMAFVTLHQFCCSHDDCENCELGTYDGISGTTSGCALKIQPSAWGQSVSILQDSNHLKEAEAVDSLLGFCNHSNCDECPYGSNHCCLFKEAFPEHWELD